MKHHDIKKPVDDNEIEIHEPRRGTFTIMIVFMVIILAVIATI